LTLYLGAFLSIHQTLLNQNIFVKERKIIYAANLIPPFSKRLVTLPYSILTYNLIFSRSSANQNKGYRLMHYPCNFYASEPVLAYSNADDTHWYFLSTGNLLTMV